MTQIQYRVAFAKNDEAVEGPDDADVVVSVGVAEATLPPATAFMLEIGRASCRERVWR